MNKTFALSILAACTAAGAALAEEEVPQYVPGALIVRSKADAPAAQLSKVLLSHGVRSRRDIGRDRMSVLEVPPSAEAIVQKSLSATGLFEYVERDAYARAGAVPNDPSYVSQWHLPKIKAPEVWEWQKGSPGQVIAVIDAGIDTNHPDFAGKLVSGWNFVSGSATIADNTGHGTAVAGVIAAATDNALGIAGVNWESKLMPLVVLDSNNYASYSNIARAIYWAVDRGVRIINISIGGTSASSTLQNAVDYAWSKDAVVFAASMNTGTSTKHYPAACNRVLAIAATDQNDHKASFSTFGPWISLSAPGVSILTTARGGGYGYWNGTSFASPLAAGVASLILSAQPAATAAELVNALQSSADDIGEPGRDDYFGYGRINVERAAAAFMPPPPVSVGLSPKSAALGPSQAQQFSEQVSGTTNTAVVWSISPALGYISPSGLYTAPAAVASSITVTVRAASAADPTKFAVALATLIPSGGSQPAKAEARFLAVDATTRGNWKGVYGADGYSIAAHSAQLPPYAALSFTNKLDYVWADNTSESRALQRAASAGYVASTWYSDSAFEMELALKDGIRHQVALYCLDWDPLGRAQRIEIVDPAGTVLDSRDAANFQSGIYLIWEISGTVRIRLTTLAGRNAVVSGIFLRTPGPNSATARFIGLDSTTRGNWKGVYGADGYSIAEHHAQLPPYAALSFSNKLNYVWANETTDARGLQRTASPGYVASTWFNDSAFEITLAFNDGLPHQVSFYCLDWDFWGRAQRIEILDAAGAVLASHDLWQFQNGVYAIWEISGSVRIRLSKLAANNAVVSGVFFR